MAGLIMSVDRGKPEVAHRVVKPTRLTRIYGPAVRCKWILPSWR